MDNIVQEKPKTSINTSFTSLFNKIRFFFIKKHTLSFVDFLNFIINALITYIATFIAILASEVILIDGFGNINWLRAVIVPFFILIIAYIRENIITKRKEKKLKYQKVYYSSLGGVIDQIVECLDGCPDDTRNTISHILLAAESVTKLTINLYSGSEVVLFANLMIPVKYGGVTTLRIKHFGTRWTDRGRTKLLVNYEKPTPGAVEAYIYKKVAYINNTESEKFKEYIPENRPYKSIISIPIVNKKNKVCAIMNIDSSTKDAFISKDFIEKDILDKLKPIISLLLLLKNDIRK
jgi:hypothetical protein